MEDRSSGAWEQLIDKYLADPAFGERFAWPWLDAARYADSMVSKVTASAQCGRGEIGLSMPSIVIFHTMTSPSGKLPVTYFPKSTLEQSLRPVS
jgi:hypothetical protein